MRVAICDDLKSDRDNLKNTLYRIEQEKNIELDIYEYESPVDLYRDYDENPDYKVIFMDVYMPGYLGTDVAMHLREKGYENSIIFCTTSEEHALLGFRAKADGYLVKPYTYEEFKKAVWRLDELFVSEGRRISFTSERIDYDIPIKDIVMIETEGKGCRLYTVREEFFTWKKIGEFKAYADEEEALYQIGRSFIINLNQIETLLDDCVVMKNKATVDFPKREITRIRQDINDYFWKMTRNS